MKIELYFDLIKPETLEALKNFKEALHMFAYNKDIEIVYKSYLIESKENFSNIHAFIQYAKRKVNTLNLLIDVLEALLVEKLSENEVLKKCIQIYQLDEHEASDALISGKYQKIVSHHMEHAQLKGVFITPYLIFENKQIMKGISNVKSYHEALVKLYEYETKQEYCIDDDCKRV